MPGFLGTPAGMTTRSQPYSASDSWSFPVALLTCMHMTQITTPVNLTVAAHEESLATHEEQEQARMCTSRPMTLTCISAVGHVQLANLHARSGPHA